MLLPWQLWATVINRLFWGVAQKYELRVSFKVDDIKREVISELQESIEKLFLKELPGFKTKFEKIVSQSYANSIVHIEKLEKEIKKKIR